MRASLIPSLLITINILLNGCTSLPEKSQYKLPANLKTSYTTSQIQQPKLRSGQIVVSESGDDYSLFFSIFSEQYSPFVHAGVLVFVDGVPFVYEELGSVPLIMGNVPTDSITGGIRRRHLDQYLKAENYTAIYDLPADIEHNKVVEYVLYNYKHETPFDPYMNTQEHDKLYCTEFVLQALKAGGMKKTTLSQYRENKSLKTIHKWLKITDSNVIQADSLIETENHVITLSPHHSYRELQLYIASREELHRRFTKNQKLGNLFEWTGFKLKFRPVVSQFHKAAMQLLQNDPIPNWQTARKAVEQLAIDFFGPYKPESPERQMSLIENPALPCTNKPSSAKITC